MTKRAILYARISTHNQKDNTSIDNQLDQCRTYAFQNGYEIVQEISEQGSGAYSARTGLETAKRLGKEGLADCIIVYKMDRFMRGDDAESDPGIDAAITERELNRCGLEVIYLDLPNKDSESYAWVKAIKRIVASVERATIRERMETGKRIVLEQGKPAHGGRCPLGYKRTDTGYFEIVESEAEAVRLIFKLFAVDDLNTPSITNYLRTNKIPGYRGSTQWGDWIVDDILRREMYIGRYAQIKHVTVRDDSLSNGHRRIRLPKSEWIYVDVPPIIDTKLWEKAQEKLYKRQGKTKRKVYDYLLSGRVTCECGYAMTGYSATRRLKSGEIRCTRYYECKGGTNRYSLKRCKANGINANRLETTIWAWVMRVITDSDFLKDLYECNVEKIKAAAQPYRERLEAICLEKLEAEKRLRRLAQLMIQASEVELSIYKPEADKLRNSIDCLTGMVNDYEKRLRDFETSQEQAYDMMQYLSALKDTIYTKADDPSFRRKVINVLELYITVALDRQSVKIDCAIGEELISLCEEDAENVCVFSASRRQCTDRKPAPPVLLRVLIPNSPAPA